MILQYIFSMAISTNLFATLLLYCVSVKFELAIPFFTLRFTFLRISLCGTVLTWGWSQGTGACTTGLGMPPWSRSQLIQALSLSLGIYCFVFWLCMYIIALTVSPVNVMFNKKKRHLH